MPRHAAACHHRYNPFAIGALAPSCPSGRNSRCLARVPMSAPTNRPGQRRFAPRSLPGGTREGREMTEAEWLACDDPEKMLRFLGERKQGRAVSYFAAA